MRDQRVDESDPSYKNNYFTTEWVKKKTVAGTFKRTPIFFGVVRTLDLSIPDPTLTLADRSGFVSAQVHRDVMELYGKNIKPGTALVLKKVPVLITPRNHYLTLTLENFVTIYEDKEDGRVVECHHVGVLSPEEVEEARRLLTAVKQEEIDVTTREENCAATETMQGVHEDTLFGQWDDTDESALDGLTEESIFGQWEESQ